jgi:uncharacterized damage-inducible protein DinB
MTDAPLVEFIRYNDWANQTVLAGCQALSTEQLELTAPGSFGTIHHTLEHIIRAEARYTSRLTGEFLEAPFKWEDKPSVAQMAAYNAQVGAALLEAAANTTPDAVVRQPWDGKPVRYQAMALFIQIINHGIEHRTNITTILNSNGIAEPDVTGWNYLDTHQDHLEFRDDS